MQVKEAKLKGLCPVTPTLRHSGEGKAMDTVKGPAFDGPSLRVHSLSTGLEISAEFSFPPFQANLRSMNLRIRLNSLWIIVMIIGWYYLSCQLPRGTWNIVMTLQ